MNKFKYKPGDVVYFSNIDAAQNAVFSFATVLAGDMFLSDNKTQIYYYLSNGMYKNESELSQNLEDLPNCPNTADYIKNNSETEKTS